ncbi:MAG: chemotaxis protein CheA, partial [Pseudomonadota bacterium]
MKSGLYAGSTLLDDGQPVLLLDVTNIASAYNLMSDARARVLADALKEETHTEQNVDRAMLFTDFEGRRRAVRLELVQRIETAPAQAIDRSTSSPRVVIDGLILPLIGLPEGPLPASKIRLLRLTDGVGQLLYAVKEVDDAVALTHELKPVDDDPFVEALTLVNGQTVSLIDSHAIFARHGETPKPVSRPQCRLPEGDWARTILAPLVAAAGYEIVPSADQGDEASEALTIWFEDEFEAAKALEWEFTGPVIRLRDQPDAPTGSETIYRYDREGLLSALREARGSRGTPHPETGEAA